MALTPVVGHDRNTLTADLRRYLERRLARPVEIVWRDNYRQTIDLLAQGRIDFAWVSVYPYLYLKRHHDVRLVATPVFEGRPYYRAFLIVPVEDQVTHGILQLEGKFFAYADPYSHSGYLVPRYELRLADKDPNKFFAKSFFTMGHANVVRAVASGLADGAYVDGYIWSTLARAEPSLVARTRIVARSEEFGFPPVIAVRTVAEKDFQAMREALLTMVADAAGRDLLARMNLDGFVTSDPVWYAGAERMMRAMGEP